MDAVCDSIATHQRTLFRVTPERDSFRAVCLQAQIKRLRVRFSQLHRGHLRMPALLLTTLLCLLHCDNNYTLDRQLVRIIYSQLAD